MSLNLLKKSVTFFTIYIILFSYLGRDKMFKIYYGRLVVNNDGTRKLIDFKCDGKCLCAAAKPFWKGPEDCTVNGV